MRITVSCELAFLVLVNCALSPDRILKKDEISEHFGVSRSHMAQVVHRLGIYGFIRTSRGRSGGIQLAKPAGEILLSEVVRAFMGNVDLGRSRGGVSEPLREEVRHAINTLWERGLSGFYGSIGNLTLVNFIERELLPSRFRQFELPKNAGPGEPSNFRR